MLKLERVVYPKIHSLIDIRENGSIEIENSFSLSVNYNDKNKSCVSTFEVQSICKSHEDWFNISIKLVGVFLCDSMETDDDLRRAHVESYDALFPYAQSIIAELTTKGGTLPLMLEKAPIDFTGVKLKRE